VWPQEEARLLSKYKSTNVCDGPWRKFIPDPKQKGFFAAKVSHDFVIHTSYGTMHGKKGDYVLKVESQLCLTQCKSCLFAHSITWCVFIVMLFFFRTLKTLAFLFPLKVWARFSFSVRLRLF